MEQDDGGVYRKEYPELLAAEWEAWKEKDYSEGLLDDEGFWSYDSKADLRGTPQERVLNRLAARIPNLIGKDRPTLAPSNKSVMKDKGDFSKEDRSGSNLHFGVREACDGGDSQRDGRRPWRELQPYVAHLLRIH